MVKSLLFPTFSWVKIGTVLLNRDSWQVYISSVESQKGIIEAQRCSVENQEGAIAVQSIWQ